MDINARVKALEGCPDALLVDVRTPEEYAESEADSNGEFAGIGVLVSLGKDGGIEVLRVDDGSPAKEAGLLVGDLVIAVEGDERELSLTAKGIA